MRRIVGRSSSAKGTARQSCIAQRPIRAVRVAATRNVVCSTERLFSVNVSLKPLGVFVALEACAGRPLARWIDSATSSLPVPVSPRIKTGLGVRPTFSICS